MEIIVRVNGALLNTQSGRMVRVVGEVLNRDGETIQLTGARSRSDGQRVLRR